MSPNRKVSNREETINKLSVEARQRAVFRMRLTGMTLDQVSKAVGVTVKTIQRDQKEIAEKQKYWLKNAVKKFDTEEYWLNQIAELELLKEELWSVYSEANPRDRVRALENIVLIQKEIDERLRLAGIRTTEVNPDDLSVDTIRIIHEYPEREPKYQQF